MTPRIYVERRGRHRGKSNLHYSILWSMVLIASQYDLEPKRLLEALLEALKYKISSCGDLHISCRSVNQDSAVFLITKGDQVIWQFPVNLEAIQNPYLRDSIKEIPIPEKKTDEPTNLKISELRFGMKAVNVTAEIIDIPQTRLVYTKWGTQALVSNVKLADETGTIRLSLWNNQIETVHVGDIVEIKNCTVSRFANEMQLNLRRNSLLSVIRHPKEVVV